MQYNKLIRDKIPLIIAAKGQTSKTHVADDAEYAAKLREKLSEEVQEFLKDNSVEELADILEVVYALSENLGTDAAALEMLRTKKAEERGGFKKRLILDAS